MRSIRVATTILLIAASGLRAQDPGAAPATLVITGGTVVTVDSARRVLTPGAVAIRGSDIVGVGTVDDIRGANPDAGIIDATDRIVMPGLVNTHTHAPMVMYRGLADDLALKDWLQQYIF